MYFQRLPNVPYQFEGMEGFIIIKDLLVRVAIDKSLRDSLELSLSYQVKEGQTPQEIASKIYDSPYREYLVLLMNEIHDVYAQWPLTEQQLVTLARSKYDDIYGLHHVEDRSGMVRDNDYSQFDRVEVSNLEYEYRLNDAKRNIRLIKPSYVALIEAEIEKLLAK